MIRRLSGLAGATMIVTALSVFVTWPQARFLSSQLAAHHDAYFSIWRIAWIAHALTTSPLSIFDANIFHPATATLAYSDATMLEGLVGAPLLWAGLPPTLVYNLLLLGGFAGSGIAMFVLARHLTGRTGPSLLAAAIFTMLPYRIEHFMHLELQWAMFVPLTLWALHRAVESTSWRWGGLAGLFLWLQVLACVYYGVFLAMTLLAFVPVLVLVTARERTVRLVPVIGAAVVVATVLTIPFALPYRAASAELGGREMTDIARYSATPLNYLATSHLNRVWGWTSDRWGGSELRLFPGATAMLLAALGAAWRPGRTVLLYAITTALAIELSFGVNSALYGWLVEHISALQGFRSLARFAVISGCGLAMLAAFGAARLQAAFGSGASRRTVVVVLAGLMLVEYSNMNMGLTAADPVEPPDAYKVIKGAQPGVVLELPMPNLDHLPGWDPYYQAWSLWHWRPLVNGYSGYYPRDYLMTAMRMTAFPEDGTINRLRAHQVRYVIVHRAFYDQERYAALMLRLAVRSEFKPWGAYKDSVGTADIFELLPVD